ncbi:N-(5-amino-5-carboxypentanoyl)-L-cysteinyl-D-valine synthase [Folsomia candida]|uniref:N-(5-amino-5-carboxypentanoyl)-L-cysteinyl-D-valine synthase n=1 Tax=Folsomia candida TaxID=158441 RepID=A0A226D051_FOLCA|nr:N-(5-amino-5-carboxypentanoyl)-L-cysteinyl-D-valine synthase [Folsomia candida]
MIDSYFNVIKACHDIASQGKISTRINEKYDSDPQFLLYEYYRNSKYNNLDTLIDPGSWNLLYLDSESHNSWVHNKSQVDKILTSQLLRFESGDSDSESNSEHIPRKKRKIATEKNFLATEKKLLSNGKKLLSNGKARHSNGKALHRNGKPLLSNGKKAFISNEKKHELRTGKIAQQRKNIA